MKFLAQLAIVFSLLSSVQVAIGQEEPSTEVFQIVENMPSFPGGDDALFKFLGENITYPMEAKNAGIEGVVYVSFVIGEKGEITETKILRGIGGGCDEEAMRVIRSMPNWEPGTINKKPVRVQYNLPIRFSLSGVRVKNSK